MFEIFLWALLIGGMPTSGYYLFQYGRKLHAHGRKLRDKFTEPEEGNMQWKQELLFAVQCCFWAGTGLAICHVLKTIGAAQ